MTEDQGSGVSDLEAVSRILRGDTEVFRVIVKKYQSSIFRLCLSYLKDEQEAEDAVQDIFLRTYRSLHGFHLEKKFSNWLYTIAFNHLKSRYRRMKKLEIGRKILENEGQRKTETPEELHIQGETKLEIHRAVDSLPEKLKAVTVLYYCEELSVGDIAEITGLGHENIKSRLFRARRKLREYLEKTQRPGNNGGIVK